MLGDVSLVLSSFEEPVTSGGGISDGLLRGERLGSDDEERRLGVADTESFSHVRSIDVGNKVSIEIALRVRLKSLGNHDGTEIGTSNTNVDDALDRLTGVTLPLPGTNSIRELLHVLQLGLDLIDASLVDLEITRNILKATCKTARPSEVLMCSPANMASICCLTSACSARAKSCSRTSSSIKFLSSRKAK